MKNNEIIKVINDHMSSDMANHLLQLIENHIKGAEFKAREDEAMGCHNHSKEEVNKVLDRIESRINNYTSSRGACMDCNIDITVLDLIKDIRKENQI